MTAFAQMGSDEALCGDQGGVVIGVPPVPVVGGRQAMDAALFSHSLQQARPAHLIGVKRVEELAMASTDEPVRAGLADSLATATFTPAPSPAMQVPTMRPDITTMARKVPRPTFVDPQMWKPARVARESEAPGLPFGERFVTYIDLQERARIEAAQMSAQEESLESEMVKRKNASFVGKMTPVVTRSKAPPHMVRCDFYVPPSI